MKTWSIGVGCVALVMSALGNLSSEPFKFKYEITANSNYAGDIYNLYTYKEKVIDIYDEYFLPLSDENREKKLINSIDLFNVSDKCRAYYVSGTIVVLVGEAKGMTLLGDLRTNSCDETVIRTKIFIFDIFNS